MSTDQAFAGSIPAIYDRYLGPLLFEPYAADLSERLAALSPETVLETAAGTGIVSKAITDRLPGIRLTVTDLNPAMLEIAKTRLSGGDVKFEAVDATSLPYRDGDFDAVVCQFGVMFFPDRLAAYREVRRVLAPGGAFLFNAWCPLEDNPLAEIVHESVAAQIRDDPPGFLKRTPYGHGSAEEIERDLIAAGFEDFEIERVEFPSRAPTSDYPGKGFALGSPLRMEIEQRAGDRLEAIAEEASRAVAERFGAGPVDSTMAALVVTARN
ncbi:class I SAM-dependent methyltransferase [Sphingomonas sp. HDW15A]|uniref:class I SAM-dependent methyltransferase n=1 Tax=Sphingomonas sp. HDW15A TaxID=2714942 RepID=UPI001407E413|nr:class I SAM-dependent methyltransferase [Sphingomonas sp. HDW15A]QIK96442.1 class I SAM-dependent methyltransferase [Sphingomonas sp. HDW15A]